jgi:FkbM family methyltransferase
MKNSAPKNLLVSLPALLKGLPSWQRSHPPRSASYARLTRQARAAVLASSLGRKGKGVTDLGDLGLVRFPYTKMGKIDSLDLFGLDELILFSLYWKNRHRFRRAVDIGANLGLHSLIMARCGWKVTAYEPDPRHCRLLRRNLKLNHIRDVRVREAAVSNRGGWAEFVRVAGNTTSSHLAGAKSGAYGRLEKFPVRLVAVARALQSADFVKIDAEGHECEILEAIPRAVWRRLCCVLEIGTPGNARRIHSWAKKNRLSVRAQKILWNSCRNLADLPKSYREGSVIISPKFMPELWPQAKKHN